MKKHSIDNEDQEAATGSPAHAEPLQPVDPTALSAAEIEDLKTRAAKADESWDRLLRTTADFDNFKKRAAREKQDAIKFANETLLQKFIPILDNFDMALAAVQNEQGSQSSLQTGVNMVLQQFKSALQEAGLEEVNAVGQLFDPNLHEAISEQETTEVPEGHVAQQLRKGYKFRERLLRPASVVVAKKPASVKHHK